MRLHYLKILLLQATLLKSKKGPLSEKEKTSFRFACVEAMQACGITAQEIDGAIHATYEQEEIV